MREPRIPLLPYFSMGIKTNHANRIELMGYSDQLNLLEMAISHIAHTALSLYFTLSSYYQNNAILNYLKQQRYTCSYICY